MAGKYIAAVITVFAVYSVISTTSAGPTRNSSPLLKIGTAGPTKRAIFTTADDSKLMTWKAAQDFCNNNNLKFAAIYNKAEADLIGNFLLKKAKANVRGDHAWLGGSDSETEGKWEWSQYSSTKRPVTYGNWANGRPGIDKIYNCIWVAPNGKWTAEDCRNEIGRPICAN